MEFTLAWQDKTLQVLSPLKESFQGEVYSQYSMDRGIMLLHVQTADVVTANEAATAIATVITDTLQNRAIENIANRALWQLKEEELHTVIMLTKVRTSQNGMSAKSSTYVSEIAARVKDCLGGQPLHLEGFLCFRMRDYIRKWASCMDDVISRAINEFEYGEYIELLKEILGTQDENHDCVYVMATKDGRFKMKDSDGLTIVDGKSDFATNRGLTAEDELICSLLVKAPTEIIIVETERMIPGAALETILRVFEGRVKVAHVSH